MVLGGDGIKEYLQSPCSKRNHLKNQKMLVKAKNMCFERKKENWGVGEVDGADYIGSYKNQAAHWFSRRNPLNIISKGWHESFFT